jgi:hypothetical protein
LAKNKSFESKKDNLLFLLGGRLNGSFGKKTLKSGKYLTRQIEGVNAPQRARNRCFVRQTSCLSKKDNYHAAAIKIIFQ